MTVGIAIITGDKKHIVTVCDRRISFGDTTIIPAADDQALKSRSIGGNWAVLFAANDITQVNPIVQRACNLMADEELHTDELVMRIASQAYREVAENVIVERFLIRFGITSISDFLKRGLVEFGQVEFSNLKRKIEEFDLGVSFIVFGFCPAIGARVFEVHNPGAVSDQDLMGISVIGSGSFLALASLTERPITRLSLEDATYRACEAKFRAETTATVGKATSVIIVSSDGEVAFLPDIAIEKLRQKWLENLQRPLDQATLDLIKENTKFKNRTKMLEEQLTKAGVDKKDPKKKP